MKSFREFIIEGSRGTRRTRRKMQGVAKQVAKETNDALQAMIVRFGTQNNPEIRDIATDLAAESMEGAANALTKLHGLKAAYDPRIERSAIMVDAEPGRISPREYFERIALKNLANWQAKLGRKPVEPKYRYTKHEGAARNLQADVQMRGNVEDSIERAKKNKSAAMELFKLSGGQ